MSVILKFCKVCKRESHFEAHIIARYGSQTCSDCQRNRYRDHGKMSQYKKRLNGLLKILSGNAIDINMDDVHVILSVYNERCVVTQKKLSFDSTDRREKVSIAPLKAKNEVKNITDIVLVSSAISQRMKKQNKLKISDSSKCVYTMLESPDVRERIRAAHERLEELKRKERGEITTEEKKRKREDAQKSMERLRREMEEQQELLKVMDEEMRQSCLP